MSLFRRDKGAGLGCDIATHLLSQDLIYVGGGSVVSLLGVWRAHGLDDVLRECWRRGIVLCGLSAGSLCWFQEAVTAFHGPPERVQGLGLLPYSNCVHYDGEPARRESYHGFLAEGMPPGYAASDGAALHFRGESLAAVVSSRPHATRVLGRGGRWGHLRGRAAGSLARGVPNVDGGLRRGRMGRTILAMGGGGFTMEPDNPALDDFILTLAPAREPKILFLPTASGDPNAQISAFRSAFGDRACRPIHLSLFRLEQQPWDLRQLLLSQDIVYVGGGSMRNLLAIWREHGIDLLLREAWEQGVVLAGISAGAMCWFQNGITRSAGSPRRPPGSASCPAASACTATATRRGCRSCSTRSRAACCPTATPPTTASACCSRTSSSCASSARDPAHAPTASARGAHGAIRRPSSSPSCSAAPPFGLRRDVPADIREFRAERYGAAGRR